MGPSLSKKPETTTSNKSLAEKPGAFSQEFQAGLLITLSVIALFALLFGAGKFQLFEKTYELPIFFDYISGLDKDSPVHYAGHKVGKVSKIFFQQNADARIVVVASIREDVRIKKDSEAYIDIMGFMGEKFLEITPGSQASDFLPVGESIRGSDPVAMMKVVRQGTELLDEFEKMMDSMKGLVGNLEGIVGQNQTHMNEIFTNLNDASKNLKDMTHDLKLHPWKLLKKTSDKKKHFLVV